MHVMGFDLFVAAVVDSEVNTNQSLTTKNNFSSCVKTILTEEVFLR